MLGRNGAYGLELQEDAIEADEVCDIPLSKRMALVLETKPLQGFKRDATPLELDCQALLIDGFEEASPHRPVDVKDRALDPEDLFRKQQSINGPIAHGKA